MNKGQTGQIAVSSQLLEREEKEKEKYTPPPPHTLCKAQTTNIFRVFLTEDRQCYSLQEKQEANCCGPS